MSNLRMEKHNRTRLVIGNLFAKISSGFEWSPNLARWVDWGPFQHWDEIIPGPGLTKHTVWIVPIFVGIFVPKSALREIWGPFKRSQNIIFVLKLWNPVTYSTLRCWKWSFCNIKFRQINSYASQGTNSTGASWFANYTTKGSTNHKMDSNFINLRLFTNFWN